MRQKTIGISLIALALLASRTAAADRPIYERRWVWIMANLLVDKEADRVVDLIQRSGKAGYNGIVISDYKLNFLERMHKHYFDHVERVQAAAATAKVEIIPGVFSIGYSNGLLSHDANLAEGMSVKNVPFIVKAGEASIEKTSTHLLINGDFETVSNDKFRGFGHQDEPGTLTFADQTIVHEGKRSCRIETNGRPQNARVIQPIGVRPNAAYRFSCWVKTKELGQPDAFRLMAIGASGRQLSFHEGGIEQTRDWSRLEVVFNTMNETKINVYAGLWGGSKGTLWLDDMELEEIGPINVLRREGCPFVVKSADGQQVYLEGKDFETYHDPKLGQIPYPGEFEFQHDAAPIRLTKSSSIKDGDRLLVSWYHPVLTLSGYAMCCLSEPKIYELLEDQARRVEALYHPKTIFMQHDEIRVANWCKACQDRNLTPGQLLADNIKRCQQILKRTSPGAEYVVWSDMFDPNHNAVAGPYYLVNGSLKGSWEGLEPTTLIANWNGGKPDASLDFFAKRGHKQIIAGYYDHDDNFKKWNEAAEGVPGVNGFMYTTWVRRYNDLERYGRLIKGVTK